MSRGRTLPPLVGHEEIRERLAAAAGRGRLPQSLLLHGPEGVGKQRLGLWLGRLLLCDALAYAAEKKPALLVDLATLTGACVVALADAAAGVFGGDTAVEQVKAAAERSDETVWPMPLYPRYTEMMQSPYADLKNGGGRWGGACTAAAFLKEFVGDAEWAHVDIAGMAWTDRDQDYRKQGATGYGVRLLWELVTG